MKDFETPTQELSQQILPWRWAEALSCCYLFWLPARLGDMPRGQREWLLAFFSHLAGFAHSNLKLQENLFMLARTIHENSSLKSMYMNAVLSDTPLAGRSRRSHQKERVPPTKKEIDDLAEGKKQYVPYDYVPEAVYWFLSRESPELRERYLGYGGLSILYWKLDEKPPAAVSSWPANMPIIIPKFIRSDSNLKVLLEEFDPRNAGQMPSFLRNHPGMKSVFSTLKVDKMQERSESLRSSFGGKSKEVFGDGMSRDLTFESLPFLVPQFTTQDFFANAEDKIRSWFEVFDIYIRESPEDEGIILACKDNLKSTIAGIIKQMRKDGYRYWEG